MNKILSIISIVIIAIILLFAGCVGKETTTETPTATPAPTSTPEQIVSTPTPNPTVVPAPKATLNITLKPGYKWYQDDEFGYRIGYPEDWDQSTVSLDKGIEGGIGFSLANDPSGTSISVITVTVYSDPNKAKFWEDPEFSKLGSLEKLKEQGKVLKYGNITLNSREGYEVIYDPLMLAGFRSTPATTSRWIVFTVNDLYYVINAYTSNEWYDKRKGTFEDAINSYVIEK